MTIVSAWLTIPCINRFYKGTVIALTADAELSNMVDNFSCLRFHRKQCRGGANEVNTVVSYFFYFDRHQREDMVF